MIENQAHSKFSAFLLTCSQCHSFFWLGIFLFLVPTASFSQYFNVNGSASDNGSGCYELTPFAKQQTGSVWSPQKVSLLNSFEVTGKMNFGLNAWTGADGIAFALQPVFNTATGTGAGLGVGYIAPSLVAEFDTYKNGYDPGFDHVAIVQDGNPDHSIWTTLAAPVRIKNGSNNVKNNQWYDFRITWDAATQTLAVYIDCELRVSYTGDVINNIFGGDPNVYWGFSAATGDKYNRHQVCIDASTLFKIEDQKICKGEIATIDLPTVGTNFSLNSFTPTTGIVDATPPNPKFSPTVTTEYIVTYEGACNSELKDTFQIIVEPAPTVDLGNDTSVCGNNPVPLDAGNGGSTFLWNTGSTAQTIVAAGAGTFDVQVTNSTGCIGSDTIVVSTSTNLALNLGNDTSFCGAFNLALNAGTPGAQYLWNDGSNAQTLNATAPGTYSVTVTAASGCIGKDTITISSSAGPTVSLGTDFSLCIGKDTTISAVTSAANVLWNTGATSKTNALSSGATYIITAWDDPACVNSDTLLIAGTCCQETLITPDTLNICVGDSINIVAQTANDLTWSSVASWNKVSMSEIKVSPVSSATYHVKSLQKGTNLVINGDFEGGNIGFSSEYMEDCASPIMNYGGFCVNDNPNNHNQYFDPCTDHTSGTGKMMIIDGATTPNLKVWCQTINTTPNTDYEFSAWVSTIMAFQPSILQFSINGSLMGNNFTAPSSACNWENFSSTWNSGLTTSAEICIVNQSTLPGGNDFALDDISFIPICESTDSVYVNVGTQLLVDLGNDTTLCAGTFDISSGTNGLTYNWNTGETTAGITVNSSGTYGVTVTDPNGSCSGSDSITVTLNSDLNLALGNDTTLCEGDSLLLGAGSTGVNFSWNTGETTATIQVKNSGTYFVAIDNGQGCTAVDTIAVNFDALPQVNLGVDTNFCQAVNMTLDAENPGLNYLWNTNATTQSINITSAGTYFVDVSSNAGCAARDSILVTVEAPPIVDLGPDQNFCSAFSHTVNAGNPGSSYLWNTGSTMQSINVTASGTYFVDVTTANNCSSSDTIVIGTAAPAAVNIGTDTSICANKSIVLDAGNHIASYQWNTGDKTQKITVNTAGEYSIIVTDLSGCIGHDTIQIGINPLPAITLPNDTMVCPGENMVISTGNSTDTHSWSNGSSSTTAIITAPTNLSVDVTDANQCTATGQISITFDDISLDLNEQFYHCSGASVTLIPNDVSTRFTYVWDNGSAGSALNTSNNGTHSLTATSLNNCSVTKSTELIEIAIPSIDFSGDTIACEGSSIPIEVITQGAVQWKNNSSDNPLMIDTTGTYSVTATTTANGVSCSLSHSIDITFYAIPTPQENQAVKHCFEEQATYFATTNLSADFYIWNGDTSINQYVAVQEEGLYEVEAFNHAMCSSSQTIFVEDICPIYLYIPNAFTPDNDGLNDEFKPVVSGAIDYELVILNRWGEIIFQTSNPDQAWNGTMNGNLVQTEVYIYRLTVTGYNFDLRKSSFSRTGTVTLVR